MGFDRKTLVIPDTTTFEERMITTKGDVVIGDRSMLQFGVKTDGRVFIGEHAIIDGNIEAADDVRVDIFSNIGGNISSGSHVFLGEKVQVKGKLSLKGDLDVADSVEIDQGFEAKGWINIRSPIPMIIYIFIYLSQLLKMGHSEEIERLLAELEENNGETIPISETFLFIPNNTIMGMQKSQTDANLSIGKKCRILGNYKMKGNIHVDDNTEIHGTLESTGKIFCGKNITIHGNINAIGDVHIAENTTVMGNISGEKIHISKTATVKGTLLAKKGTSFIDTSNKEVEDKVKRFDTQANVVDEMKEILE